MSGKVERGASVLDKPLPTILTEMDEDFQQAMARVAEAIAQLQKAKEEAKMAAAEAREAGLAAAAEAKKAAAEAREAGVAAGKAAEAAAQKAVADLTEAIAKLNAKLETLDDVVVAIGSGLMTKADGKIKLDSNFIERLTAAGFEFKK